MTFHVNYYLAGLLQAFTNGRLEISDKYSFDVSLIQSEADWLNLMDSLLSNAEKFACLIESFSDDMLLQPFVDEKYGTCLRNIEGVIEHCYYHLGQISLIKKLPTQQ